MKVAFVHLGNQKAKHLDGNIQRLNSMFPKLEIVLIGNTEYTRDMAAKYKLPHHWYEASNEEDEILQRMSQDLEFRQGFWRYSVERFIALSQFHAENPSDLLIHLESDVIALANFPFEQLSKISNLAWTKFNKERDVASIVVLPNAKESKWLSTEVLKLMKTSPNMTDMTSLSHISANHPTRVQKLPTNPGEDSEMSQLFKGGIFDAAPIGMWLTGRDPRNHFGFIPRFLRLPESEIDLTHARFDFTANGGLRMKLDHVNVEVYNLHIHSKRQGYFGHKWRQHLRLDVFSSRFKVLPTYFSLGGAISVLSDFRKRHQGKSLVTQMKIVYKVISDKSGN